MAKGAESKQTICNKLLEVFPGSFMQDDKILRIPCTEGGDTVEIKVTLTAAKDILGAAAPAQATANAGEFNWDDAPAQSTVEAAAAASLTEDEKTQLYNLLEPYSFIFPCV